MSNKGLNKVFGSVSGDFSGLLSESTIEPTSWVDSGSYSLNALLSGSVYKGWPRGKVCVLAGPSGCGKSLMIMKAIGNHLKSSEDNGAIIFDTEYAIDQDMATSLGADPSRIHRVSPESVLDVRNKVSKILDNIKEEELDGKILIAIDSLGNLPGSKELDDVRQDKSASDMGLRAKEIKAMFRAIVNKAGHTNTLVLISNHIYEDPNEMFAKPYKKQSGGKGPEYMSSLIVQLSHKDVKSEKEFEYDPKLEQANQFNGIIMTAKIYKNRFGPKDLKCEIYNNFINGLDRYYGMLDIAKNLNVIEGKITYTLSDGTSLGRRKEFERNPEIWENTIFPVLNPVIEQNFKFKKPLIETDTSEPKEK